MVEDVLISMGLDHRPVTYALRGVRKDFASFKSDLGGLNIGGMLKGGLAGIGIGLGASAIAGAVKGAADYANQIRDMSEAAAVSTDVFQAWSLKVRDGGGDSKAAENALAKLTATLGEARAGSQSALDKFSTLGIALYDAGGKAKGSEEVLRELMDRVAAAKDPVVQLSMASEIFGDKLGVKVVGALKDGAQAFDDFKKASSGKIVTEENMVALDLFSKKMASMGQTAKGWWSNAVGTVVKTFAVSDAQIDAQLAAKKNTIVAGDSPEVKAEKTKKLAEATLKLEKARRDVRFEEASESQKIKILQKEVLELAEKTRAAKAGSVEKITLQTELYKKEKDILEQIEKSHKQEDEWWKKKLEKQKKLNEKKEKERQTLVAINKAQRDLTDKQDDISLKKSDRSKFTLEELASMPLWRNAYTGRQSGTNEMMANVRDAKRVTWMEGRARELASVGYYGQSQELFSRADKLRSGISALTGDQRFPYAEMQKAATESNLALQELLTRAKNDGLKVVPQVQE